MKLNLTPEETMAIENFNHVSGMSHRSTSYDLDKVDDLDQAFWVSVARYIDYSKYNMILSNLINFFDESVEHYDILNYIQIHHANIKGEATITSTYESLMDADFNMSALYSESLEDAKKMLLIVLMKNAKTRKKILGDFYVYNDESLDTLFDNLVSTIESEIKEGYTFERAKEIFMNELSETLGTMTPVE